MKKLTIFIFFLLVVASFAGTGYFLYKKSEEPPVVHETVAPLRTDIVKKTVATGSINPRQEIEIKSHVSGVVDTLYVEAGDVVEVGQLIAKIRIIPSVTSLHDAESTVEAVRITYENDRNELTRQRKVFEQNLISESEFNAFELAARRSAQELEAAIANLELVREGASKRSGTESNLVHSTAAGMVLDVPVEVGNFVIESNTFNDGTTIAAVANMNEMIFEGRVDESEVGKIRLGMPLDLRIGALDTERFNAELEFIAPKGIELEGAIQFEIRAKINMPADAFLRAGYSANADIVLDRRENVLAVREADLLFEDDKVLVEVETGAQVFAKKEIQVGLSDGIHIEVLSGLDSETRIKKN
ncbi:efflux RND transporter periplasmic adaptor subunit [Sulfidibacter corallicola]|uniref:efflux RND transporter periplasmic adaptor subunit n=1 Tax=Sulfidibacter corallicola TaxID=2818388 RepID=UPI003B210942